MAVTLATSCLSDVDYDTQQAWNEQWKLADKAELAKDYRQTEYHYRMAAKIADDAKWEDGYVRASIEVAYLCSMQKRTQEGEDILAALRVRCEAKSCISIRNILRHSVLYQIYNVKNCDRAAHMIKEIEGSNEYSADKELIDRVKSSFAANCSSP